MSDKATRPDAMPRSSSRLYRRCFLVVLLGAVAAPARPSWQAPQLLTETNPDNCHDAALAPNGLGVVAWGSWEDGLYARLIDPQTGLGSPLRLEPPKKRASCPTVAVGASGWVAIVWAEDLYPKSGRILARVKKPGAGFGKTEEIGRAMIPRLDVAVTADESVWVAWADGSVVTWARRDPNGTYPRVATAKTSGVAELDLGAGTDGALVTTWVDAQRKPLGPNTFRMMGWVRPGATTAAKATTIRGKKLLPDCQTDGSDYRYHCFAPLAVAADGSAVVARLPMPNEAARRLQFAVRATGGAAFDKAAAGPSVGATGVRNLRLALSKGGALAALWHSILNPAAAQAEQKGRWRAAIREAGGAWGIPADLAGFDSYRCFADCAALGFTDDDDLIALWHQAAQNTHGEIHASKRPAGGPFPASTRVHDDTGGRFRLLAGPESSTHLFWNWVGELWVAQDLP